MHLAWSAALLLVAGALIGAELSSPCPPGGPLAAGTCGPFRDLALAMAGLTPVLYLGGLSGVLAWTSGLRRRGLADARAARDWYLLAALVGVPVAPLLAFTLLSALR